MTPATGNTQGIHADPPDARDLRRDFADRDDLIAYLRAQFPQASAHSPEVSPTRGGRAAAEAALRAIDPGPRYEKTRNSLDGAVTRLSAYIRHGVLSLAEVRDHALTQVRRDHDAEKFVNELGWRDYWQRLYREIGDGIWDDREDYKTGVPAERYADDLPADIRDGQTGLACIDGFSAELRATGYLHNHQRLWLAAYIVHWRRVRWQAGARWFLTHLIDGDPASNNLSWQWVASTFSHKPYFFNRENLEKFTHSRYCAACPLHKTDDCPFEGTYDQIERRLFPNADSYDRQAQRDTRRQPDKRRR